MFFVASVGVIDVTIASGDAVAQVAAAAVQTRLCSVCGAEDTDAWELSTDDNACKDCGGAQGAGPSACRLCSAGPEAVGCLSYAGCPSCRPEVKESRNWRRYGTDGVTPSAPGAPGLSGSGRTGCDRKEYPKGMTAASRLASLVCAVQVLAGVAGRATGGHCQEPDLPQCRGARRY